jgi:signal transduction histidine kinase
VIFGGLAELHALFIVFSALNTAVFTGLAVVAALRWRRRRDRPTGWAAVAFIALGLIVTVGRLVPSHPHGFGEAATQRLDIELLVLFPYLLYRFATEFAPPGRRLQILAAALTTGLTIWTFALRHIPAAGEHRSASFDAYLVVFLIHWAVLSTVVTLRLWRAGRNQPSVSANRMRMLSFAAAALTVALIGAAFSGTHSVSGALAQVLAFVAGIAFLLGLDPPGIVRVYWRLPEQARLQDAVRSLLTLATTRSEIAQRVLAPSAELLGARGAELTVGGEVLATHGDTSGAETVRVREGDLELRAWTSSYAPFFGEEELRLLETMAALTRVAVDRVRLFEQEHEARVALERANELMTNFVALAAHELRTPVTTVHGFVQTLHRLEDRIDEKQRAELRAALEQQTARLAGLVEQLLDLSRLDAEAIEVRPQQVDLRERLEEVVSVAAGARGGEVSVDVDGTDDVLVDPAVLDHIVTNLVTNALRYGRAPIRVSARQRDGRVEVAVEDAGPGVAREIEDSLFERFTRAGVARDRVSGTGLGLAIARAYARAHRGDLRYERGQPSGARFVVDLPSV